MPTGRPRSNTHTTNMAANLPSEQLMMQGQNAESGRVIAAEDGAAVDVPQAMGAGGVVEERPKNMSPGDGDDVEGRKNLRQRLLRRIPAPEEIASLGPMAMGEQRGGGARRRGRPAKPKARSSSPIAAALAAAAAAKMKREQAGKKSTSPTAETAREISPITTTLTTTTAGIAPHPPTIRELEQQEEIEIGPPAEKHPRIMAPTMIEAEHQKLIDTSDGTMPADDGGEVGKGGYRLRSTTTNFGGNQSAATKTAVTSRLAATKR